MKMRTIIFACSILTLALIFGGVILVNARQARNKNYENVILEPDTAIKIGKAILNEHFPQKHEYENLVFVAKEDNGIWIVTTSIVPPVVNDNEVSVIVGGSYYVHIRKSSGEILEFGVHD